MKNHRTGLVYIVISLLLLTVVSFPAPASTAELPKFITISGFPMGTLGSLLLTGFCSAIDKHLGIKARPTPGDTDMGRVLPNKTGESQAMLICGTTIHVASQGLEEFSAKGWGPQKLRRVFSGNNMYMGLSVKANSGIKTWADLKGKRVTTGPGSYGMAIRAYLAYAGLTVNDVKLVQSAGYNAAIGMVESGAADCCQGTPQAPAAKRWETAPYGLRFLLLDPKNKEGLERLYKIAPFFSLGWCDYGALGEGGARWMLYYPYVLTAYDTVDNNLIEGIVKSLVDGRDMYKDIYKPDSELWTLEETLNLNKPLFIPFHPGVIKYAKEKGKWTAEHDAWQAKMLNEENIRIKAFQAKN